MTQSKKAIVIGAGMAGLTAAYFLEEAGVETVVIERDNRPGGRIESIDNHGDIINVGAQFIHTNYNMTLELVKKFNLESDLAEMQENEMMERDGRKHVIPWGSVRIPTVSMWSLLKFARLFITAFMRRKDMALEGYPNLLDLDRLEVTTYARLKLNEESLEYLVRPLMLTYSMSEPEGISVAHYLRSLYMYVTTGAHCFKSGNDVLPKAMAAGLDVHYDTSVKGILCDSKGSVCAVQTSQGEFECSAVISAVPSPELLPLFSNWDAKQQDFLEDLTFSRMPIVLFEGPIPDTVNYWGGVFDRLSSHRLAVITYPHMAYTDAGKSRYLMAWPYGEMGEELIDLSDEKIIDMVTHELRNADAIGADSIKPLSVFRHLHTFPKYEMGMFQKLLDFKTSEGRPAGLYLAGDYTEGGLIEGAALSGCKAARRLIAARA